MADRLLSLYKLRYGVDILVCRDTNSYVTIYLPKKVIEKLEEKGLDIGEIVIRALAEVAGLDPEETTSVRVELAEKSLEEAKEFIAKRNIIQASEKLYKAVEECIKALSEKFRLPQLDIASRRGRWDTWLLGQAATDLSKILKEERISYAWSKAYEIRVWSFHEAKYRVEDVESATPIIEWLVNYIKDMLTRTSNTTNSSPESSP